MPRTYDRLLSFTSAAQRLDCSLRTLRRLIAAGDLPRPVRVGGLLRFFERDLGDLFRALRNRRSRLRQGPFLP